MMDDSDRDFSVSPGAEIVSDSRCFVCGLGNAGGLRVRFFRSGELEARASCEPGAQFMGYDGLLHGGVASALLDEIMIKALLARGRLVVTGRLSLSYHHPIQLGRRLLLRGWLTRQKGRLFYTAGRLSHDGEIRPLVSALGTYPEVTGARRTALMQSLGPQS